MEAQPLPDFSQFLAGILTGPFEFYRPSMRPDPAPRSRFLSPCEDQGCDACTGVGCDCSCHLAPKEEL